MDTSMSFRSMSSKADEQEERSFRRNTRRRAAIIGVSALVLVAVAVCMTVGILIPSSEKSKSKGKSVSANSTLDAVCHVTLYPDTCNSSISSLRLRSDGDEKNNVDDPENVFALSLMVSLTELNHVSSFISFKIDQYNQLENETMTKKSLLNCKDLITDAIDKVNKSQSSSNTNDTRTWLSTALTDHETCADGITTPPLHAEFRQAMRNSTEYTSNSLAIATNVMAVLTKFPPPAPARRRLLWAGREVPAWVRDGDRRLLAEERPTPNVTVAKDGSGDYGTVAEAVAASPEMDGRRFVVYVKEGVYVENVVVGLMRWNVMIYGDGMNKTVVSGSLNFADHTPTFSSGTLIAVGQGFIAKDMGFINTAGPTKLQAVAVRSSSDKSIFYRCSFDAYQDTLYVHSNRQLFRDCHVTGTVDFIFGFAAAVFQGCLLRPRQPLPAQFNAVTAHGKFDPNQNTGISIQRCRVTPNGNVTAATFLGRPWKDYSTTVVVESFIDGVVDPAGWSPWDPSEDPPSGNIFYGERGNSGPGAGLGGRVNWAGYRPNMTAHEAAGFSVDSFIQGDTWLPPTGLF